MKTRFVLAVYEVDRAFGGHEEGGWWYDTGELVAVIGVMPSEDAAFARCRRLNAILTRYQDAAGVRDVSSVLYRGGRLSVEVYEDAPPAHYPAERPYYS